MGDATKIEEACYEQPLPDTAHGAGDEQGRGTEMTGRMLCELALRILLLRGKG